MDLISLTSTDLRLHSSPSDLGIVREHRHSENNENFTDLSVMAMKNCFGQLIRNSAKESTVNFRCVAKTEKGFEFSAIRKVKGESITAISFCNALNKGVQTFAFGNTAGAIKINEIKPDKVQFVEKLPMGKNPASVTFLNYSSDDLHLASVHENGLINIYGMRTKAIVDSFTLDNQSSLVRFHPEKRSQLAVASFNGAVNVLDIHAKKPIFTSKDAHSAPCSDVNMTEDLLLSSGYDTLVKIFDLRKKSFALQIQSSYGWTTLAISKCGGYFVGGNMKGELVSYDMRNIKKPLASSRVGNANQKICRVSFVKSDDNDVSQKVDVSKAVRQSLSKVVEEISDEPEKDSTNESFIEDIVGFQKGRISDFSSNAASHGNRASVARCSTSSRLSDNFGKNMNDVLNELSETDSNLINAIGNPKTNFDDSRVNKTRRHQADASVKEWKTILNPAKESKRRSSVLTPSLQNINEETANDKENDPKFLNSPLPCVPKPCHASTPTIIVSDSEASFKKSIELKEDDDSFKSISSTGILPIQEPCLKNDAPIISNLDFRKEFDALSEKIRIEVGILSMDQSMRHIEMMSHVAEQRRRLHERVQLIEDSLALLMNDDFKINRIMELQAENQHLRDQVQNLVRRMSQ